MWKHTSHRSTCEGSAQCTQTSIEGASYIQAQGEQGLRAPGRGPRKLLATKSQLEGPRDSVGWSDHCHGRQRRQLVEKAVAYGEGGGPFNRGDDISEPMEEGSCFGAHAPLRLKDDGLVRHPGFAGREPRSAGVSCGRTSRRSEGGITMSLPQCVDFPNLQVLLSLPRAGSNRTLNPKPDTTITLTERSEQNSPLLIRSPLNLVHHLITPDACSDS